VVNAFQEPSATPAQLPYKGRPSFASIVTMTARTAAAAAAVGDADSRTTSGGIQPPVGSGDIAAPALVVIDDVSAE